MEKNVDRILSMGGRLQRLLEEAEAEADNILSEARAEADAMINEAKEEADYRLSRAQRGTGIDDLIKAEEEEAQKGAQEVRENYLSRVKEVEQTPMDKREEAVNMIIDKVIPE